MVTLNCTIRLTHNGLHFCILNYLYDYHAFIETLQLLKLLLFNYIHFNMDILSCVSGLTILCWFSTSVLVSMLRAALISLYATSPHPSHSYTFSPRSCLMCPHSLHVLLVKHSVHGQTKQPYRLDFASMICLNL
jgi:hypothetical protein